MGGALPRGTSPCAPPSAALLARVPLRPRLMDVDAGRLGAELPRFFALRPPDRALAGSGGPGRARFRPRSATPCTAIPGYGCTSAASAGPRSGCVHLDNGREIPADHVWLGTGYTFDARNDPVTASLVHEASLDMVEGLLVLLPDLSWGGTSVCVSGGPTELELGPAARGLAGARMAERYTEAITGHHASAPPVPDGRSATARLVQRRTACRQAAGGVSDGCRPGRTTADVVGP